MSVLADYLRRVRTRSPPGAASGRQVTLRRLALSVAVALLGAALVRRLRSRED